MKVAVVVGVAVQHDAISSAAIQQASMLTGLPGVDEVVLFTQWIGRDAPSTTHVLGDPWALATHPDFRDADVAIFHWGIYYTLFDALTVLSGSRSPQPVVHFHNCTPADLVEPHEREGIVRSKRQIHHAIGLGVPMWTYSEFNRLTLLDWGASPERIAHVTFPISTPTPASRRRADGIHILTVGRMVPAKGFHVLLEALDLLPTELLDRTSVRVTSSNTFSSEAYATEMRRRLRDDVKPAVSTSIRFDTSPPEAELMRAYQDAHILVSTSYHEGLCVPVIEAYAAGCRVIGTTAGNLPFIVIPPDPVTPVGDPVALAGAIEDLADSMDVVDVEYHQRRRELVESFSLTGAAQTTQCALASLAGSARSTS
jgi:glycosyltransferase involved in cell wall biosynthesis